jgi:hypothetical protein
VLYNAACGFANASERDRALDLLDRAVAAGRGFRAWMTDGLDRSATAGSTDPRGFMPEGAFLS